MHVTERILTDIQVCLMLHSSNAVNSLIFTPLELMSSNRFDSLYSKILKIALFIEECFSITHSVYWAQKLKL